LLKNLPDNDIKAYVQQASNALTALKEMYYLEKQVYQALPGQIFYIVFNLIKVINDTLDDMRVSDNSPGAAPALGDGELPN
jgi:hypothetical protein